MPQLPVDTPPGEPLQSAGAKAGRPAAPGNSRKAAVRAPGQLPQTGHRAVTSGAQTPDPHQGKAAAQPWFQLERSCRSLAEEISSVLTD